MRLPKRDVIATGLVAVAGLFYGLWAADAAPPGMSATRVTGLVVIGLGFAASASAVVPTFEQLLHGNKAYAGITSLIGLAALFGAIQVLVAASDAALGLVMGAMVVLWLAATIHHRQLANAAALSPASDRESEPRATAA